MNKSRIKLEIMGKPGTAIFFDAVTKETPDYSSQATTKPVEKGVDVADHIKHSPTTLPIDIIQVHEEAWKDLREIKKWRENGELVRYTGRNIFNNMAITKLTTDHHAENSTGFDASMTLTQIAISEAKTFENGVVSPETGEEDKKVDIAVKEVTSKGLQQASSQSIGVNAKASLNDVVKGVA